VVRLQPLEATATRIPDHAPDPWSPPPEHGL